MRVGLVVNPIAGMGGRVGLKGTDGKVEEARRLGAEPRAPDRAGEALETLRERAPATEILTYGGEMGAEVARAAGFAPEVLGAPRDEETTAADTRRAVRAFAGDPVAPDEAPPDAVDLILFVGGDGTAVDVAEALETAVADLPVLGVPAGVKVYSAVFAVTPRAAGRLAAGFERTEQREVNDVDEAAYRDGEVRTELQAIVSVPVGDEVQSAKQVGGRGGVDALAEAVAADVDPAVTYVLGPGSTLGAVAEALGFSGSPLGVDVWRDGEVLVRDASESEILGALNGESVVVVSPIGGQGFIFGRGNQQLSPAVLRRSEIEVIASRRKLEETGVLRVDTGDPDLDESLRGWIRVRVGRFERRLVKVV